MSDKFAARNDQASTLILGTAGTGFLRIRRSLSARPVGVRRPMMSYSMMRPISKSGGKDVFRCGPKGDLKFRGETHYLEIVLNIRVVFKRNRRPRRSAACGRAHDARFRTD